MTTPFDNSHVHGTDPFLRTEPFDRHQPDPTDRQPDLVCLGDVPAADVRWLWPGRIPLGRVTLLVSDPGVGKSLLALDIAARVSRAAPWPDQKGVRNLFRPDGTHTRSRRGPKTVPDIPDTFVDAVGPGSVLLLTAQDELADTVRPRLEAAGADLAKIHAFPCQPSTLTRRAEADTDPPTPFHLGRDLDRLAAMLDQLPDCRLIVIDPISAFLGGRLERSNTEVQHLVNALSQLARDRDLAILAVSHFRKKQGAAIHRAIGSVGFVAAARTAWALAPDPDDPARRLFLPLKNNLGPNPDPLAFTIEPTASAPGRDANDSPHLPLAPLIRWSDQPVDITAEAALAGRPRGRPDHELRHAVQWLQKALADGPRPVRHIQQEAEANGHTQRTLFRAFHQLGGQARRRGSFLVGQWYWLLPPTPQPAPDPTSPAPTAAGAPAAAPDPANSPSPDDEHFWQSWENLDDFAPLEPPTPTQPTPTAPPPNTHPPTSTTPHPAPTTTPCKNTSYVKPQPGHSLDPPRAAIYHQLITRLADQIGA